MPHSSQLYLHNEEKSLIPSSTARKKGCLAQRHLVIRSRAEHGAVLIDEGKLQGEKDMSAVVLWAMASRSGLAHRSGRNVAVACGPPVSRTNLVSSAQAIAI